MSINHIFNGGYYQAVNPSEWSNLINGTGGGGGVESVTGTTNEIEISGTAANPIIGLPDNIRVNAIVVDNGMYSSSINTHGLGLADVESNPVFTFPVISSNPAINTIIVSDGPESNFETLNTLLSNTDNNISIGNGENNICTLNLANSVNINELSINEAYTFPTSAGKVGDVLFLGPNGVLGWISIAQLLSLS